MLDTIAIKQQKELYKNENQMLKTLLKQYIDNISINDDVMANDNPLLVAEKARIELIPERHITASYFGRGGFQDATEEANKVQKQLGR